jgi:hypothetical protein
MKPRNLGERITNVLTNIPRNTLQLIVANMPVSLRKCANSAQTYVEIVSVHKKY